MRVYVTLELDVYDEQDLDRIEWVIDDVIDNNTDYTTLSVKVSAEE